MLGIAVLFNGCAALASHFWNGQSWSTVLWLATSLSLVVTAVMETKERRRSRPQGD